MRRTSVVCLRSLPHDLRTPMLKKPKCFQMIPSTLNYSPRNSTCCAILSDQEEELTDCQRKPSGDDYRNQNNFPRMSLPNRSSKTTTSTATHQPLHLKTTPTHTSYIFDVPQPQADRKISVRPSRTSSHPKVLERTATLLLLLFFSSSLPLLVLSSRGKTAAADTAADAITSSTSTEYTNEFALHIKECADEATSAAVADQLAAKYGFVNHGKVRLLLV